jgi:hypothetical protein
VWLITVAPQHQIKSGVDIYTDEIPVRRLAVEQFGAHPLILSGAGDYAFVNHDAHPSEISSAAVEFWFPLLDYSAQLVMTALLHQFEEKKMRTQVLQGEAVAEFSSLLNNAHAATADLVLEAAGVTSHSSNAQLLETMSQRSEEDDILQTNTLLEDACWDKIWQSVPSTLEEFLTQHIEGLAPRPRSAMSASEGDEGNPSDRVRRTCRCEVYVGSGTLISEVNKRATLSGSDAASLQGAGNITEIPLLTSKRVATMLRLHESDSIDGHVDALHSVLRSAMLRDTAAVQSYSEVSFQEKAHASASYASAAGGAKAGKTTSGAGGTNRFSQSVEKGPHVEFHTVIAVPLLRSQQQDAVYQHMTIAEEHEMGSVKGCVLVHVVSVLVDTSSDLTRGFSSLTSRAHPTYTASFSTGSTNTHSAYMEQLAGSYNLLESGRQPLVMGVVDIIDVLGGMLLTFLYAHNCRPLNLLPMSAPSGHGWPGGADAGARGGLAESGRGNESAVALSLLMGSASTSYADASRWNNCITDGLFSLLLPPSLAGKGQNGSHSGVAPSLESLAYTEEAKSGLHCGAFQPLSQDHILRHNAREANVYAALVYHMCTLFHSDWAMVFTLDPAGNSGQQQVHPVGAAGERAAHWAQRLSATEDDDYCSLRLIDTSGSVRTISSQELPVAYRTIVTQALNDGAHHGGNRAGSAHSRHGRRQTQAEHEFIREIPGVKSMPMAELLPLLHVDARLKQSIHQVCDSDAAPWLHHSAAICLDPHTALGSKELSAVPPSSSIVILTGRFFRGPFYTPMPSTPAVTQLNMLFQTAIARRDLLYARETVQRLVEEKNQSVQEIAFTKSLEEKLTKLHKTTLSGEASNISCLVAFRKGLLSILIDFFSDMHRLHFASYLAGADGLGAKGLALEVIGLELVVDESTGLEEGRTRKWALSATTADWVRVQQSDDAPAASGQRGASAFQRSSRRKVVQAAPQQTLHSQLNVADFTPAQANLTAEVVVDELRGVYEERGASVLHIHRKQRHHAQEDRASAVGSSAARSVDDEGDSDGDVDPQDLIGMLASIHVHYEHPVAASAHRGASLKHSGARAVPGLPHAGNFYSTLHSGPVWMRILRNFIGSNAQALFQPLYPIYTPLKLQNNPYQQVSIDEEQQWEDDALYAQASNLAINALSTTIVHDSTRLLNGVQNGSPLEVAQQHPHYRYLHQRKLLRQLTVVPPFSAFMLIPIRELTTTEVSAFDEESDTDSSDSSAEVDVEDVRYIHLLPASVGAVQGQPVPERKKGHNPHAQCMLPLRLNESIRDAVRSAREERLRTEETLSAAEGTTGKARRAAASEAGVPGSHRIRTSRLTVLDSGMGSVLHNYLSDLHERQQRRRAHNTHRGNHEYDLYGYVDVDSGSGAEKGSARHHAHEMALVDAHSLVLLYTPLLHCARKFKHGLDALDDEGNSDADQGLLTGDTNASLDHYYLVVCRQDRMIVPSSLQRLQTCLDELFLPSRVLAASQPWFECMAGIEQIIKAATMDTSVEFKTDALDDAHAQTQSSALTHTPNRHRDMHVELPQEISFSYSAPLLSVEGQCQRILMESISIMKRIVGDRCLGAVGYQLRVNQNDLPDLMASTAEGALGPPTLSYAVTSDTYRSGREIELVRCCSDVGLVSAPTGKVMTMLQGPSRLQCPATAAHIMERFSPAAHRTHKSAGSPLRHGHHGHGSQHSAQPKIAIHYVEMSSLEHIKQLQHSASTGSIINSSATPRQGPSDGTASPNRARRTTNVAAVQEVLNAAHVFLRADVRVLQLLITASPSVPPHSREHVEPHVVASVLLYLSQSTGASTNAEADDKAAADELPTVAYIHRDDVLQQVESMTHTSLHRASKAAHHQVRPPHVSSLTRGILSCLMRVGDTTGALVSSLYRQQYDSYLQAHATRHHRTQMQVHAQRLANTLLQIDHDLSALLHPEQQGNHHDATGAKSRKAPQAKVFHFGGAEDDLHSGVMEDPKSVMTQFLTDAEHQKEAAEQALDSAHHVVQQFYAFKQQFVQEQQSSTEVRSKCAASVEECRRKATQFRKFYEAVRAALSIVPQPVTDDDADSLHSGLDKVAEHNAAVPELLALQTAVASAACNTQTLRKALEVLSELAAHEEFSQYFGTLLAGLSQCGDDDATLAHSDLISGEDGDDGDYDRILQVLELTPYGYSKKLALEGPEQESSAPDMSSSVWWVLEPGSHISAIDLASAVQAQQNGARLDPNTLHSKEKFLEALNTKQSVLVEGEELLRLLPHLMAHFSAYGHSGGTSHFPSLRLLYQPILATLPTADDVLDDISYSSDDESRSNTTPGETVVVAVVQYVMAGGSVGVSALSAASGAGRDDRSTLGGASGALGSLAEPAEDSLAGVLRQVGRERVEQAIAYMGQHITLHSKVSSSTDTATASALNQQASRSTRYSQHTLTNALNQFVPRLLQENNLISGIHFSALISALRYIMDPVANAPPSAPAASSASAKKDDQSSRASRKSKRSGSSVSGRRSGGSVKNLSTSSRSSEHSRSHNAEKVAAAAVYNPISVWIGKLLATAMRAEGACMLHISGSVKPQAKSPRSTSGSSDNESTASNEKERHSAVVYEGPLYKYAHGTVTGGAANDERSSLNILHVRPSAWTPLQTLIESYQAFFKSHGPESVFVTYQESVLSYARKSSSGAVYSSRSVASHSHVSASAAEKGPGVMRYILACSINTSVASIQGASSTSSAHGSALARRNVHFVDTSEDVAARTALKENDDFVVVELSRRPTSADLKAFAAVTQLVQAFVWGQGQRNCIKQKDTELSSISGALATTSQRLVEEQRENQLHNQYAELMHELHRQMNRSLTERSVASASSVGSGGDAYLPPGGEFTPRVTDILQCVQRSQDLLCEVFGDADSVTLLAAPRMICSETRDLLRSDTMSVASRGSSGVDDELMGNRVDTVTRNISKRALARIMAVEHVPTTNGVVNAAEYHDAAAAQYEVARRKFASLAVQLNQVLVCDVADIIADEAMSLNLNISKAVMPAIARSVMIPVIDHAAELSVVTPNSAGTDLSVHGDDEGDYEGLPTDRLPWLHHALKLAIGETLGHTESRVKPPEFNAQNAYFMQHYYDQRPRAAVVNAAVASTVHNGSHAWALQVVFPTLEARDQYVSTLLGGALQSDDHSGRLSESPSSSPFSSPVKGGFKEGPQPSLQSNKGSSLPITFVAGVSQYLKSSFVQCRSYVKDDVALLQARVEQELSDKVSACMDQVLLLTSEPAASEHDPEEDDAPEVKEKVDVTVDAIAAAVAHMFTQLKAKGTGGIHSSGVGDLNVDEDSSGDEDQGAAAPAPTSSTFECSLGEARLHWVSQPQHAKGHKPGPGSVRFSDHSHDDAASLPIGTWFTVSPEELEAKRGQHSAEEAKGTRQDSSKPVPAPARGRTSAQGKDKQHVPLTGAGARGKPHQHVEPEPDEDLILAPKGYQMHRDPALYQRCHDHQWRTHRSALTAQQIQSLKDSPDGFLLFVLPPTAPHITKPKRGRSSSPTDRRTHTGAVPGSGASYSSASRQRPHAYFSGGGASDREHATDQHEMVGAYMNADGTVHLQLLVLVAGSEQPAVVELRVKCHVTSGSCSPEQLARQLNRRHSRKKQQAVPADELALAEMMEQVTLQVLQPTLPTLRLVRSSVAHLLEHCVAARGLVAWEADWEEYLQHAQQRISLLSTCMALLTSEGYKAAGLLQVIQEALCRLPSLCASTLIARDTVTNQVIYNRTMDYSSNTATDFNVPPTPSGESTTGDVQTPLPSATSARVGLMSPAGGGAFSFSDSAIAASTRRAVSPNRRVAYMDISRRTPSAAGTQALTISTLPSAATQQRSEAESLKDQFGHVEVVNPALDSLEQLELVFECYEVQGSLTVYFASDDVNFQHAGRILLAIKAPTIACYSDALPVIITDAHASEPFSPATPTAGGARAWSPTKRAPVSPYEPLKSPGAHRRAKEQQRRTRVNLSALDAQFNSPVGATADTGGGIADEDTQQKDLVSLNTLLETITRALARRVFELHRGSKNKKMMATKQHELSKRT